MRKHPPKCKICGEYLEPIFEENIGRSYFGAKLISNPNTEPINWKCVNEMCSQDGCNQRKVEKMPKKEAKKEFTYDGCKLKLVALLQRNVIKSNNIKILEQFENLIRQQTAKEIFKDLESKFTNKITDTIMWKKLKEKWLK